MYNVNTLELNMHLTLADRSNYFKGLLLLIRKDNVITHEEEVMLLRLGEILQFNREFCENTIRDLLQNPHIDETPPLFSNRECAELFLLDGIKVAFADHNLHKKEYAWMQEIAAKNDISAKWLSACLSDFLNEKDFDRNNFEIERYSTQQPIALSVPA